MDSDRRGFLKAGARYLLLTFGGGAALESFLAGKVIGLPERGGTTPAPVAPGYDLSRHWWGMIIDIEKCIGCGNCVRACKRENNVVLEPFYFRTWVERYHVPAKDPAHLTAEDSPEVDSPNGGYDGFPERYHPGDGSKNFFVPKLCNHCAHSPCVQVCPVGATFESPDGVVLVDEKYCLGCRYCVQACPYGCRYIDPRTHTADKCTLCYHRITRGLTTACCETCPTGARTLGDLKDPSDPIHEFLATHKVQVLKPQMATGAKAYYNGLDVSVR